MAVTVKRPRDFLSPSGYKFFIRRLPKTSFWVQQCNLPGLALQPADMPTPLVAIPMAGEHLAYNELVLRFRVDEDLENFLEIHNWIRGLGKPTEFSEYAGVALEPGTGVKSDATLMITDAKRRGRLVVTYHDAFPVALSDLVFDATLTDVQYLAVDATFRYTDFDISVE